MFDEKHAYQVGGLQAKLEKENSIKDVDESGARNIRAFLQQRAAPAGDGGGTAIFTKSDGEGGGGGLHGDCVDKLDG